MAGPGSQNQAASKPQQRAEVAAYVASLSGDLIMLSRRNGLEVLAYLLDMARLEAEAAARAEEPARDPGASADQLANPRSVKPTKIAKKR